MKELITIKVESALIGLGLCVLFAWLSSQEVAGDIDLQQEVTYHCDVKHPLGERSFNIYIPIGMNNKAFNQKLCDEFLVGSEYARVNTYLIPRSELDARRLSEDPFELIFSRDYLLQSVLIGYSNFYFELVQLPTYEIWWMSRTPLEPTFSLQPKIGLLSDKRSQSGYMEPLKFLNNQYGSSSDYDVEFYDNRESLERALLSGQVDIIPATALELANLSQSGFYTAILNEHLGLGTWYMHYSVSQGVANKVEIFIEEMNHEFRRSK